MTTTAWRRVCRAHPCPVCGRPDWCVVSTDGGVAICPRVESSKRAGDAGWLHRLIGAQPRIRARVRHVRLTATGPDLGPLAAEYRAVLDPGRRHQLACTLGLSPASLAAL